jgi:hypothetical protein
MSNIINCTGKLGLILLKQWNVGTYGWDKYLAKILETWNAYRILEGFVEKYSQVRLRRITLNFILTECVLRIVSGSGSFPVPVHLFPGFYYHSVIQLISRTNHNIITEFRSRVINTPASYSGDPGFKSRPGDRLSWLRVFVVFLSLYSRMPGYSTYRFLPNPFQFVIYLAFHSTLYSISTEKAPFNKLQINKYETYLHFSRELIS